MGVNHRGLKKALGIVFFCHVLADESEANPSDVHSFVRAACVQSHSPPPGDPYLALHPIIFYDDKFHHKSHLQMAI